MVEWKCDENSCIHLQTTRTGIIIHVIRSEMDERYTLNIFEERIRISSVEKPRYHRRDCSNREKE